MAVRLHAGIIPVLNRILPTFCGYVIHVNSSFRSSSSEFGYILLSAWRILYKAAFVGYVRDLTGVWRYIKGDVEDVAVAH